MYNSKSNYADEFISHEEIMIHWTGLFMRDSNKATIYSILEKAELIVWISNHREAAALLMCDDQEIKSQIFNLARKN